MRVFLDDEPLKIDRPTLADAFGAAIEQARGRGRVIIDVTNDGDPISGELLADPPDEPIPGDELRFTSVEPWSMVHEIMHQAADALDKATEHQRHAAEHVLDGRVEDARQDIETSMGIWHQVVIAIQRSGQLLEVDLERLEIGDPPELLGTKVRGLADLLQQLSTAVQSEDWSTISDLLAYELHEQASIWQEALLSLARAIREEGSAA